MATLTMNVVPHDGVDLNGLFVAADVGLSDQCATGPGVFLAVKNGDTVAHTVDMVTPQSVDGDLAIADRQVSVAVGAIQLIPVLDLYRDRSTGLATFTYDAVTSVQVAALRIA